MPDSPTEPSSKSDPPAPPGGAEPARRGRLRWLAATPGEGGEALRARYGVLVVFFGLGVTLGAFVAALIAFDTAEGVSTAIAPITGLIGTIVGAYFGIQKGAEGREAAEAERAVAEARATDAERTATKLAGVVTDPAMLQWALGDDAPWGAPPPRPNE